MPHTYNTFEISNLKFSIGFGSTPIPGGELNQLIRMVRDCSLSEANEIINDLIARKRITIIH